jgi:hypothetical protein
LEKPRQQFEVVQEFLRENHNIYSILANHRAHDAFVEYFLSNPLTFQALSDVPNIRVPEPVLLTAGNVREDSWMLSVTVSELKPLYDSASVISMGGFDQSNPQKDEEEELITPSLGSVLRGITLTLREEEVKRKHWSDNPQEMDDSSRRWLEKIAWFSDWNTPIISIQDLEKNGLFLPEAKEWKEWNEHIGFIERVNHRRLKFICSLYQYYSAAEYSCDLNEDELKEKLNQEEPAKLVKSLRNELIEFV